MMRTRWILGLLTTVSVLAQNPEAFKVNYVSAEHIYIDGGREEGLIIGDTLTVLRGDTVLGNIRLIYAADHSASCKIIDRRGDIQPGDAVHPLRRRAAIEEPSETIVTKSEPRPNPPKPERKPVKKRHRIYGSLSLQWYRFDDVSDHNYDFSQPTIRFTLKGKRLWDRDFNLRVKVRTRYQDRSRSLSSQVPETEWRNRIYEVSFSYDDETAPINFRLGRIISNAFSGVGYIDGAQVAYRPHPNWQWGIFGGVQPVWQFVGSETSLQKYGTFIRFQKGDYKTGRMDMTLAASGEYHGPDVSRELISFQTNYATGSRWSLYQTTELDINRGWRKEKTGESLSLSGLFVSGRYQFRQWIAASLSYDNRKSYYTWELRSVADSLFREAFRQGLRAGLTLKPTRTLRIFTNGGIRNRKGDSRSTVSYSMTVSKSRFLLSRMTASVTGSGFNNLHTNGFNLNSRLGISARGGHSANVQFGAYSYQLKSTSSNRLNLWARAGLQAFFRGLFLSGYYQYDWGDDVTGHRLFLETGYRF